MTDAQATWLLGIFLNLALIATLVWIWAPWMPWPAQTAAEEARTRRSLLLVYAMAGPTLIGAVAIILIWLFR